MRTYLILILTLFIVHTAWSQEDGVEDVIVETYCTQKTQDGDTIFTYRIFLDLKKDYVLQAIFGNKEHPLIIESTDTILNSRESGVALGNMLNGMKLLSTDVIYDSFVTLNAVTNSYNAVLKTADKDGSLFSKRKPKIKELKKVDGLKEGATSPIQMVYMSGEVFGIKNVSKKFYTDNGAWAAMQGVTGPTEDNVILIAQITTKGKLSFELNVQVGNDYGGVDQYVAKNARGNDISCKKLNKTL